MTRHGWRWYAGHALLYSPIAITVAGAFWTTGPLLVLVMLGASAVLIFVVLGVVVLASELIESDRKDEP